MPPPNSPQCLRETACEELGGGGEQLGGVQVFIAVSKASPSILPKVTIFY